MKLRTIVVPLVISAALGIPGFAGYQFGVKNGTNAERTRQFRNFISISNNYRRELEKNGISFSYSKKNLQIKTYDSRGELVDDQVIKDIIDYMDISADIVHGKEINEDLEQKLRVREWDSSEDYKILFSK